MYAETELKSKNMRELVSIYNGIEGTNNIKRFGSKPDGVQRILKFQAYSIRKETKVKSKIGSRVKEILKQFEGMTNGKVLKTSKFQKLCANYNVEPTVRQVSKFRNYRGKLFFSM
jgi:hypothetical protein